MRSAAALLFLASAAAAQAPAAPLWTPEAYVQEVLARSPDVLQAGERLTAASARERGVFAQRMFPTLSFSAVVDPAEFGPNNRFTLDTWQLSPNDFVLTPGVSWNLFNSFRDRIDLRSNVLGRDQAAESLSVTRQSDALAALQTYFGLVLAEKLVEVARADLETQRANNELTQDRYRHGMKSLTDLLKTETDLRSSELRMETREAERRLALFQFNVRIERPEDAPAAFPPSLALGATELPRLDEGLREALRERPEMRRSAMALEAADLSLRKTKINAGPTVSLDFTYTDTVVAEYGTRSTPFGLSDAVYGFALRLALPSGFNVYSQVKEVTAAKADRRRATAEAEALARRVREEVYRAHIDLQRSYRSFEIAQRKEEISRRSLELVQEQYSQGSATVIQLSEAQTDFLNAQVERMTTFRDAKISRAAYQRAIGVPIW